MADVLISESVCTGYSDWRDSWGSKLTQIEFSSVDNGSENYCFSSNPGKYYGWFW